jgi:hypothetical protein
VRLVKAAAQGLTASIRRWSRPWDDASIATRSIPSARISASSFCSVRASGVVWMPGALIAALDPVVPMFTAGGPAFPDLAGEARHAGLAVGPGDGDHGLRPRPEPERGGMGERGARILGDDHGDVRARQRLGRDLRALAVGQDRRRAVRDGAADEARAMDLRAGQRREQRAGPHLAAVDGDTRHARIGPALAVRPSSARDLPLRHPPPAHPNAAAPGARQFELLDS